MHITYNNQSLLASGCYEERDTGVTRMGREVIREMNRLGMVIDMSHSARLSTLETIALSERPIAITHANRAAWHGSVRNKEDDVLKALAESGGMLGFSLYAHHLKDGPSCTLESFCRMVADTAGIMGAENIGIGSDLCQDQPDEAVTWMRNGNWTKSGEPVAFPPQPAWFARNSHFRNLAPALRAVGFSESEVEGIMGGNWLGFYDRSFGRKPAMS
jgi:microsomal dipeptidase-like Zn-dependent dipeptidase